MAKGTFTQRKKSVGNYPSTNVIFSIATALFMIGLFSLFAITAKRLTTKLRNDIQVKVFLLNNLSQELREEISQVLGEQPYVDQEEGKPRVSYLSKEEAAEQMIDATGEDFISFLGENPLRDAFVINITENYYSDEKMAQMKEELERVDGVFEVYYPKEQVEEINVNIQRIALIIGIFVLILIITVVILINNSIKLALFSQRFLIRSMQLVGATPFFIKKPFLLRAGLQGVFSGFIASVVLASLLFLLIRQSVEFKLIFKLSDAAIVFAGLLLSGGIIGWLSAYSAVSRYLKMKLDELY